MKPRSRAVRIASLLLALALFVMPVQALAFDDIDDDFTVDGNDLNDAGSEGDNDATLNDDKNEDDDENEQGENADQKTEPGEGTEDPENKGDSEDKNNLEDPNDPKLPDGQTGGNTGGGSGGGASGASGNAGPFFGPTTYTFLYTPQPSTMGDVEDLLTHYDEEDEATWPKWQFEIEASLIPEGWEQIKRSTEVELDDDQGTEVIDYYTLKPDATGPVNPQPGAAIDVANIGELMEALANGANYIRLASEIVLDDVALDVYGSSGAIDFTSADGATIYSSGAHFSITTGEDISLQFDKVILDGEGSNGGIHVDTQAKVSNITISGAHIINCVNISALRTTNASVHNITIRDSVFNDNGNTNNHGGAVHIQKAQNIVIEHTTFSGNKAASNGGAVYVHTAASVTLESITATGNEANKGGAVFIEELSQGLIVNGGTFTDNQAGELGGAIQVFKGGKVDITGGIYDGNTAQKGGGAIFMQWSNTTPITIKDTVFTNNRAEAKRGGDNDEKGGGALFIRRATEITLDTVTFTDNYAGFSGAGAYIKWGGDVKIKDCTFTENKTAANGALSIEEAITDLLITGGKYNNNIAGENGAGLNIAFGIEQIKITGVEVIGNTAAGTGGGIAYETSNEGDFYLENATIKNNTATSGRGGGVFLNNYAQQGMKVEDVGDIFISNSTIEGNKSGRDGGAIMSCNTFVYIEDTKLIDNYSAKNGGGVAVESATEIVSVKGESLFERNVAGVDGGAIYVPFENVESVFVSEQSQFVNNSASSFALTLKQEELAKHQQIHNDQILTKVFSDKPGTSTMFDYAYNNYDVNYTENYEPDIQVRVNYIANGGELYIPDPDDAGQMKAVEVHELIIPIGDKAEDYAAKREGYIFTGWYTDVEDANSKWNFNTEVKTNLELYAGWETNVHTVTFHYNYSGAQDGGIYKIDYIDKENPRAVNDPGTPTRNDHTFDGWYEKATPSESDMAYDLHAIVTGNLDLYAKWTKDSGTVTPPKSYYHVNFYNNYPDAPNEKFASEDIETTISKAADDPGTPTRTGFIFTGWYEKAEPGEGDVAYNLSAIVTRSLNLYAHWEPVESKVHTITFHFNYIDAPDNGIYTTRTVEDGKPLQNTPNTPIRTGHTFAGWYEKADPGEGDTAYDFAAIVTRDLNLYANWIEDEENPGGNEGGGGGDGGRPRPGGSTGDGGSGTYIADNPTPLVNPDPGVVITDDDVPLEELPFTGATSLIAVRALGSICLAYAVFPRKWRKEDDAA